MTAFQFDQPTYHLIEKGYGTPLILLHGFTGSSAEWKTFIPDLATGHRVIAVDLPGHGQTQPATNGIRVDIASIADELERILYQRQAVPAHWLGYSMGGRLALYVGLHKPHLVQSLILESASPGLASAAERRMRREQDESLAKRIETNGVAAFVDDWERLPLFDSQKNLPADVRNALRRRRLQNTADGLATSLRGMGTGVQPSLWANLPELRVRTLLLAGEYDHKFTTINQRMAEKIPNARLIIINGTGHSIHLEQPDIFLTVVQEFLAQPQPHWQDLSGTEQQDKDQSRQRHLLEPGV